MEQTIIPLTKLFFELIQISLGNRKEFSCIPSAKDWFGIYELAHRQALTGVLFTGITLLPQNQKPPQKLLLNGMPYLNRYVFSISASIRNVLSLAII